ncbi:MAG: efflux transporter outer membrane subunit [Pseudomonadota bacterium]|nr:efflux transporter outer membrane subunit [Pseudomonadota bacterium]
MQGMGAKRNGQRQHLQAAADGAFRPAIPLVLAWGILAGCSFEPPLHLPQIPSSAGYTHGPAPTRTAGARTAGGVPQQFLYGQSLPRKWWELFHSPRLDEAVRRALINSPTIAAARAQLRQARASMQANAGIFYPQVSANFGASRQKTSGASFGSHVPGSTYSLFTGGIGVTYYPDIFGINRLVYRGSRAQAEFQRYQLAAAQLTLSGNVVNAAIGEAAVQAQINATRDIIAREHRLLSITEAQYRAGATAYVNVLAQQAQVLANDAALPPLEQQLAVYRHLMAVLGGEAPSEAQAHPFRLEDLSLPGKIPVALPSTLLRNRPDILAAEQQMRYALAGIGIARAQFFPVMTLSASAGTSSPTTGSFFSSSSSVWDVAAALTQPIFEGGRLTAQKKGAYAAYDMTLAAYKTTVLGAFQQVADALRALQHDGETVQAEQRSLRTVQRELRVAEAAYRSGAADYLSLLSAEIAYQNARIASVRVVTQRYQDTAALFVALGGDRWTAGTASQRHPASVPAPPSTHPGVRP